MKNRRTQHDAIIFDLDGTLWDSTAACASAWNLALRELNLAKRTITEGDIERIMGMTLEECFATSFPEEGAETRLKIAAACFAKEIEVIKKSGAAVYPGVRQGLKILSESYPLYIVSNCFEDYLNLFYSVTGLRSLFRDAECHGRTNLSKAENIRLVIERNGILSGAYVGDTAGDQEAAKKAKISFYHVTYGFGQPSAACPQFANFSEVVKHFVIKNIIEEK